MLLMFIGNQFELTTIHSALFPERTTAIITEKAQQHEAYVLTDEVATPETFELYRMFLYTGEISSHDSDNDQDHVDDGHAAVHEDREWVRLANAYLLGLKLEDEKSRNAVVDALLEKVVEAVRFHPLAVFFLASNNDLVETSGSLPHRPRHRCLLSNHPGG